MNMQLFEWWEFSELAFLSLRSKSLFLLPQKNFQAIDLEVFQMVVVAELESATPCVSYKKCLLISNKL